jgi:hypothetical protein
MANRAWAERNPDEAAKRSSRWQKENPERVRAKNLRWRRKKDGLPTATRPVPIGCECCGRALESGKKTHLDHCHATGKFRGWLCNRCNLGIGALGDSTAAIERALAYLKRAED